MYWRHYIRTSLMAQTVKCLSTIHLSFVTEIIEIKFFMDSYIKPIKRLKGGMLLKYFTRLSDVIELYI